MSYINGLEYSSFSGQWQAENSFDRVSRAQDRDKEQNRNKQRQNNNSYSSASFSSLLALGHHYDMSCKWEPLRDMILAQWNRLTSWELDAVGPNRRKLATLIQTKYGVETVLIENYLRNFERVLPVA